jgi:hypothetical protein
MVAEDGTISPLTSVAILKSRELCVAVPSPPHTGARGLLDPPAQRRRCLRGEAAAHRLCAAPPAGGARASGCRVSAEIVANSPA